MRRPSRGARRHRPIVGPGASAGLPADCVGAAPCAPQSCAPSHRYGSVCLLASLGAGLGPRFSGPTSEGVRLRGEGAWLTGGAPRSIAGLGASRTCCRWSREHRVRYGRPPLSLEPGRPDLTVPVVRRRGQRHPRNGLGSPWMRPSDKVSMTTTQRRPQTDGRRGRELSV